MSRLWVASVVAAMVMVSGCSQKSTTESDLNAQKADSNVGGVAGASGSDNFVDMDKKTALIRELESELKSVYFDFDKFNIRADQQGNVDADSKVLTSSKAAGLTTKLEGNCDEWGTDEYNYALGLKRAKTVRDALQAQSVDVSKVLLVSYGESKPVCSEKTKSCWQQNRRVDFKLLP